MRGNLLSVEDGERGRLDLVGGLDVYEGSRAARQPTREASQDHALDQKTGRAPQRPALGLEDRFASSASISSPRFPPHHRLLSKVITRAATASCAAIALLKERNFPANARKTAAGGGRGSVARRGRGLTAAGRKRLSELRKKRWAERRRKAKSS
jgi:hypothetical protein